MGDKNSLERDERIHLAASNIVNHFRRFGRGHREIILREDEQADNLKKVVERELFVKCYDFPVVISNTKQGYVVDTGDFLSEDSYPA